jgi:hypothetical protein
VVLILCGAQGLSKFQETCVKAGFSLPDLSSRSLQGLFDQLRGAETDLKLMLMQGAAKTQVTFSHLLFLYASKAPKDGCPVCNGRKPPPPRGHSNTICSIIFRILQSTFVRELSQRIDGCTMPSPCHTTRTLLLPFDATPTLWCTGCCRSLLTCKIQELGPAR